MDDFSGYVHHLDPDYKIKSNTAKSFYEPSAARTSQFYKKDWILRMFANAGKHVGAVSVNGVDMTSRVKRYTSNLDGEKREVSFLNLGTIQKDTKVLVTFSAEQKADSWVDLGTGILWATCNVGASQPTESGNYFTWDNAMKLGVQKGRLPTREEVRTLISQCRHEVCEENGVKGVRFYHRSNRDVSIFFPARGLYGENKSTLTEDGKEGAIWTDTRSNVKEKMGDAYEQRSANPLLLILGDLVGDYDRAALAYSVEEDVVQCINADKGARINVRLVLDK